MVAELIVEKNTESQLKVVWKQSSEGFLCSGKSSDCCTPCSC